MKHIQLLVLMLFVFFQKNEISAQCNPDVTPPVAICDQNTVAVLDNTGHLTLTATVFDDGSYDACSAINLFIEEGLPPSVNPPITQSLDFDTTDIGFHDIVMWVVDQAGNASFCVVNLEIEDCKSPPVIVCNYSVDVVVSPGSVTPFYPADMLEGGPYCLYNMELELNPPSAPVPYLEFDTSDVGTHLIKVSDSSTGNACWGNVVVATGFSCNPDTEVPVAVCPLSLPVGLDNNGQVTVWGADFDEGSYDLCSAVSFFIEENSTPSPIAPTTESLDFDTSDLGSHDIVLWVSDQSGNWNTCSTVLLIKNCIGTANMACNDSVHVSVSPGNNTLLPPDYMLAGGSYCYFDMQMAIIPATVFAPYLEFGVDDVGTYIVQVQNVTTGNSCWGNVYVTSDSPCTPDIMPPVAVCDQSVTVVLGRDLDHFNTVTVSAEILDDGSFDNCTSAIDFRVEKGSTPSANAPSTTSVTFGAAEIGQQDVVLWVGDEAGNWNKCFVEVLVDVKCALVAPYSAVGGTVFIDAVADCQLDSTENHLAGWPVKVVGLVSGDIVNVVTDSNGYYFAGLCAEDTLAEVSLQVPFNYGQTCQTTHTVVIPLGGNFIETQDVPVALETGCPLMQVDIASPFIRRCFDNYYIVSYCNYHSETIEDVYVEVSLDTFLTFTSATVPGTSLGANVYSFEIGNLEAGECGYFRVDFNTSCNAVLGYTHCTEAHIFPDTLCGAGGMNWSGADIRVFGYCDSDTVRLSIQNVGQSAMIQPQEYIVVEDVVMFEQSTFDLPAGETFHIGAIEANGATWRLEADQEPGHPYGGVQAVAVEGCQGLNVPGLVNLFPISSPNPFIASDCQENIGSFDPNDKQAFPIGYGTEHFIEQNTDIEYLIRFQNTGTDTAFNVAITDELDAAFDPMMVRPGASSHPYQFELIDGHLMRFTFNNIMLPDSNVNEPASHGFVKFKASQMPDLPLGTVIENSAAIYFDFNDPILTNTTFHTIGNDFIEVIVINDANERPASLGNLLAYPNPSFGDVTFKIPTEAPTEAVFILHDALGKQLVVEQFSAANTYRFERGGLAPGVYFYKVEIEGLGSYAGKVVLK